MSPLTHDDLPALVTAFVSGRADGRALLETFGRHVATVCRPYPDAYFALGRKNSEAVDDLAHRAFTTCARVEKGRFPFMGRTPFVAFVQEQFEGRAIRYHSFYAKLSITRELLRADYAHNLSSDPRLAWRADTYAEIGDTLRRVARKQPRGPGLAARWELPGLSGTRASEALVPLLARLPERDVPTLVTEALRRGGPRTQAELAVIVEDVLGAPPSVREMTRPEPIRDQDADVARSIRAAIVDAWRSLDASDRELLQALSEGLSYDEICERHPRFAHKVAVNRAVERISKGFITRVLARTGGEAAERPAHRELMELVLDVIESMPPSSTEPMP